MEPFDYFAHMRDRLSESIRSLPPACGVFLPSDDRLALFLEAARHAGKTCPEDFLLVGVDNQGGEAGHPLSDVSSVDVDAHAIGRTAREVMIRWIQSGVPPQEDILVPPTGVVGRASTRIPLKASPLVHRALQYIQSQDRCTDSVDSLASILAVSRATLHRQFREHLGLSPKQMLQQHRMERAHRLLTTTDLPLEDIAVTCGFAHASSFVHAFRQVHGCTPGEFRRQHPAPPHTTR
ncbi:MAG: helix-turn-helix domain-containing protein [Opitutales bacterium]|nr:helix-turn-helix domain-containing protein [Opitutales bacterium]